MQRDPQRFADRPAAIDGHAPGTPPTRADRRLMDAGDECQSVHATRKSGNLVNGHAADIATGNSRMQGLQLPRALTKISPFRHLVPMEKKGDPFIGSRVCFAREARGLTQTQLASRLGIGQGTISGIETAWKPAGRDMLGDIADALQIPVDFFYEKDILLANIMLALKLMPRDQVAGLWLFVKDRLPPGTPTLPTQ